MPGKKVQRHLIADQIPYFLREKDSSIVKQRCSKVHETLSGCLGRVCMNVRLSVGYQAQKFVYDRSPFPKLNMPLE